MSGRSNLISEEEALEQLRQALQNQRISNASPYRASSAMLTPPDDQDVRQRLKSFGCFPMQRRIFELKLAYELDPNKAQLPMPRHPAGRKPGTRSFRYAPGRTRARKALKALFPNDIPDQASCPNNELEQKVAKWLKTQKMDSCSRDTILRAAGRRNR
jgi:hypothetical protein